MNPAAPSILHLSTVAACKHWFMATLWCLHFSLQLINNVNGCGEGVHAWPLDQLAWTAASCYGHSVIVSIPPPLAALQHDNTFLLGIILFFLASIAHFTLSNSVLNCVGPIKYYLNLFQQQIQHISLSPSTLSPSLSPPLQSSTTHPDPRTHTQHHFGTILNISLLSHVIW